MTLTFLVVHKTDDKDASVWVSISVPDTDAHDIIARQHAMDYWRRAVEKYFPGARVEHQSDEVLAHSFGGMSTEEFMTERESNLRDREKFAGSKVRAIDDIVGAR